MSSQLPITVFAPATVANLASGFDILGLALDGVGDEVRVLRSDSVGVKINSVTGIPDAAKISLDPIQNTAGLPILKMLEAFSAPFGIEVFIQKGIPLGSGMGGSAASAVGGVVAAHALLLREGVLRTALSTETLLDFALIGEAVASGAKHADNIAPCLYGGLTLSNPGEIPKVIQVPYPQSLYITVVHPELRLDTKTARSVLKTEISLKQHAEQSARLASLILGFATSRMDWIAGGLEDILIEPQRAHLIPGFAEVKKAALAASALGASISGAGPSVFALAQTLEIAERAKEKMIAAFHESGKVSASGFLSKIRTSGARIK